MSVGRWTCASLQAAEIDAGCDPGTFSASTHSTIVERAKKAFSRATSSVTASKIWALLRLGLTGVGDTAAVPGR